MKTIRVLKSLLENNEIQGTAKLNTLALSGNDNFAMGKITKSPFRDEDHVFINNEALVDLFKNCAYVLKILYNGLGSKHPVDEKIVNANAVDEFKNLVMQKICSAPDFNTTLISKTYNVYVSDLNKKIDGITKSVKDFTTNMKIVEIYSKIEDLYQYLLPLMRQIAEDATFPTYSKALDLSTVLNMPMMYKNPLMTYLYDLRTFINR